MRISVHHSLPGRLRVRYGKREVSPRQAILAQSLIAVQDGIEDISVNTVAGSYLIFFDADVISRGEIENLFRALTSKYLDDEKLLENVAQIPETESVMGVFISSFGDYYLKKWLLPLPVRTLLMWKNILPRVFRALCSALGRGKVFSTDMLDATALVVAAVTGNTNTASQISLLLDLGEDIEEITKRSSYGNLAHKLLINNEPARLLAGGEEKAVPPETLKKGDLVVVREGSTIPADGTVEDGEGAANQASITGEPLPAAKRKGSSVFAGTVLVEGELKIRVISSGGDTKVQNIINMIDSSQGLKAEAQRKSEMLAERIVPFNFLLAGLTWLFTGNVTKTMSTLMVDYSCAMKLSAPIAVLSAMKEAADNGITVKGGKFLEAVAEADTVVFDKTGTLTYADPVLEDVLAMDGFDRDFVLQTAACLEEHFPHPLGRAVVKAAEDRGLRHPENHSLVQYRLAHGIASTISGKKVCIGSAHFIFEDEKIPEPEKAAELQKDLAESGKSLLYLSYDGKLAGILAIGDPIRPDAADTVRLLKSTGVRRCVMITGDTEGAARKIAGSAGLDGWRAQALPEDKVSLIESERSLGHKVVMLGDGINDAPALSAADVGIAAEGCSSVAGDTADIVLTSGGLGGVAVARQIGQGLVRRISSGTAGIIGINTALLLLGVCGFISPQLAAVLHNSATVAISAAAMRPVLTRREEI